MKLSGPGLFFFGMFLITNAICLLVICLLRFSSLYDSVLTVCVFRRIHPFLLGYSICWHMIVHSSLIILFISVVSAVALSFSNEYGFLAKISFMLAFINWFHRWPFHASMSILIHWSCLKAFSYWYNCKNEIVPYIGPLELAGG